MKKVWGIGRIFMFLLLLLAADAAAVFFGGEYAAEIAVGIAAVGLSLIHI